MFFFCLLWIVGVFNGENIFFYIVEVLFVMLNEWYIVVDCKFSYINKNYCDRNVVFFNFKLVKLYICIGIFIINFNLIKIKC